MEADPGLLLDLPGWSLTRRTPDGLRPILRDIHLRIPRGGWLAVLGGNGSGKSSLLKHLAAEESPLRESSAIMFQDPDDQLVAATVARELTLGRPDAPVAELLAGIGLPGRQEDDPRLLSAGQKQRLVLAVALAGEPRVLLADEPIALQDPAQSRWVLERLRRWVDAAPERTLVTACGDRRELERADTLMVLAHGRVALQGPVAELRDHPLVSGILGKEETAAPPAPPPQEDPAAPPTVEARDLVLLFGDSGKGLKQGSLRLAAGARLGIHGSNGCGKSTLLAALAGARRPDGGQIRLCGRALYQGRGLDLEHGRAMLAPQFPEYLFTRPTVAEELAVDPALAGKAVPTVLAAWGLPGDIAERNPHSLSTGQRRRLALGLVLASERPVLLLDEPTAALDHQGRQEVLAALAALPAATTLVMASHDRDFLRRAGCRLLDLDVEAAAG
ncbi:hypothetical protein CSB20_09605 [bacterium DOLZORAL124_64_63]|nr:MAG: hypothetical protein CSB20_09605 [bacterium DOLZORAL124_64_63]